MSEAVPVPVSYKPIMSKSTPPPIGNNNSKWQDGNQYQAMLPLLPPPCESQQQYQHQHIPKPHTVITKVLLDARNPKESPSVSFRSPVENVPSSKRLREIKFNSNTEVHFNTYGVGEREPGEGQQPLLYLSVMSNRIEGLHVTADTTYGVHAVKLNNGNRTDETQFIPACKIPVNILPAIVVSDIRRYRQYEDNSRKTVLLTESTPV